MNKLQTDFYHIRIDPFITIREEGAKAETVSFSLMNKREMKNVYEPIYSLIQTNHVQFPGFIIIVIIDFGFE